MHNDAYQPRHSQLKVAMNLPAVEAYFTQNCVKCE